MLSAIQLCQRLTIDQILNHCLPFILNTHSKEDCINGLLQGLNHLRFLLLELLQDGWHHLQKIQEEQIIQRNCCLFTLNTSGKKKKNRERVCVNLSHGEHLQDLHMSQTSSSVLLPVQPSTWLPWPLASHWHLSQ